MRRALSEGGDKAKAKEKWQLVAQSLVSLGNLFSEIGDSKAAGGVAREQDLERKPLDASSAEERRSCTLRSQAELYRHALEVPEEAGLTRTLPSPPPPTLSLTTDPDPDPNPNPNP